MTSKEAFEAAFEDELLKMGQAKSFEAGLEEELRKEAAMIKEAPFKSKAQQRFMFLKHPRLARRWAKETDFEKLPERLDEPSKKAHVAMDHKILPVEGRLPQPAPGEKLRLDEEQPAEKQRFWKRMGMLADDVAMAGMNLMRKYKGAESAL